MICRDFYGMGFHSREWVIASKLRKHLRLKHPKFTRLDHFLVYHLKYISWRCSTEFTAFRNPPKHDGESNLQ